MYFTSFFRATLFFLSVCGLDDIVPLVSDWLFLQNMMHILYDTLDFTSLLTKKA